MYKIYIYIYKQGGMVTLRRITGLALVPGQVVYTPVTLVTE